MSDFLLYGLVAISVGVLALQILLALRGAPKDDALEAYFR